MFSKEQLEIGNIDRGTPSVAGSAEERRSNDDSDLKVFIASLVWFCWQNSRETHHC
ncbi:MAG: hypothetical protein HC917_03615 [Richelia sp. SM2_1_7]|nr:hypothetical protein [Richelia sp. SM2_1_7]